MPYQTIKQPLSTQCTAGIEGMQRVYKKSCCELQTSFACSELEILVDIYELLDITIKFEVSD